MKIITLVSIVAIISGCATSNYETEAQVEFSDSDKVVVCGEVGGEKQTYPTFGDLKADGANFLFYGPCYQ